MASTDERLDELMEHCQKHGDLTGENGFLSQLFRTTLHQGKKPLISENPECASKMGGSDAR